MNTTVFGIIRKIQDFFDDTTAPAKWWRIVETKRNGKKCYFVQKKCKLLGRWHFVHDYAIYKYEICWHKIPRDKWEKVKTYTTLGK